VASAGQATSAIAPNCNSNIRTPKGKGSSGTDRLNPVTIDHNAPVLDDGAFSVVGGIHRDESNLASGGDKQELQDRDCYYNEYAYIIKANKRLGDASLS